jgi:hypothetical protein
VLVSQKGLDLVSDHLSTFEEYPGQFPQNTLMIQRLQDALDAGTPITCPDAVFYTHEASEATLMSQGLDYDTAHAAALAKYQVSPFAVYHPDVIQALPEQFNSNFFKFYGLDK